MSQDRKRPPAFLAWWEGLDTWKQLAISFPPLSLLLFLINIGPFYQPVLRSIFYGLFEGGIFTALLAVATRSEREKRR